MAHDNYVARPSNTRLQIERKDMNIWTRSGGRVATTMVAAALLALSACGGDTDKSSPSGEPIDDTTPLTIKQAVIPAVTNLLPLMAEDYASEFNLTIETTTATNVQTEITAAQRGDVDIFPATPAGVIIARDSNLPLVMLGGGAVGSTQLLLGNDVEVSEGDWGALNALADDKKSAGSPLKFGSAVAGSANFVECHQSLMKNGLEVGTDVELVTLPNFPDHPAALKQGEIDILCTPEPFATNTITSGVGKFFATPFDTEVGNILGAMIVTEETLEKKRNEIARYMKVLAYTAEQILKDPDSAVKRVIELANTDEAGAKRMLKYTQFELSVSEEAVATMASVMFEMGQTTKDWSESVSDWIDLSLLEDAG